MYIRHRAFSTRWGAPNGPSYLTPDLIVSKGLRTPLPEITRINCSFFVHANFQSIFDHPKCRPRPQKPSKGNPKRHPLDTIFGRFETQVEMWKRWFRLHETIILRAGGCPETRIVRHFAHSVFQCPSRSDFFQFFTGLVSKRNPEGGPTKDPRTT